MAVFKPGPMMPGFRGRVGNAVFVPQPNGAVIVRQRPTAPPAPSPLQQESTARMRAVSARWKALTPAQIRAWQAYAAEHGQQAYRLYVALATKRMQADRNATPPTEPPTAAFLGDSAVVTVAPRPGGLAFRSDRPNAADVVTELLLQPLESAARRTYPGDYRSAAFVPLLGPGVPATLPCRPGWVAAAVRFVKPSTGQASPLIELGSVWVEAGEDVAQA